MLSELYHHHTFNYYALHQETKEISTNLLLLKKLLSFIPSLALDHYYLTYCLLRICDLILDLHGRNPRAFTGAEGLTQMLYKLMSGEVIDNKDLLKTIRRTEMSTIEQERSILYKIFIQHEFCDFFFERPGYSISLLEETKSQKSHHSFTTAFPFRNGKGALYLLNALSALPPCELDVEVKDYFLQETTDENMVNAEKMSLSKIKILRYILPGTMILIKDTQQPWISVTSPFADILEQFNTPNTQKIIPHVWFKST